MNLFKENKYPGLIIYLMIPLIFMAGMVSCMNQEENEKKEVTSEDVMEQYDEAMDETGVYLSQEKKDMLSEMEKRYSSLKMKIKDLNNKMSASGKTISMEMKARADSLRQQQEQLRVKLDTLSNASEGAWDELSSGADKAFDELEKSLEKARNEFDSMK